MEPQTSGKQIKRAIHSNVSRCMYIVLFVSRPFDTYLRVHNITLSLSLRIGYIPNLLSPHFTNTGET
jgi:hypothetical protein